MKKSQYTVLIADTDAESRENMKSRFSKEGFRVFSVDSGKDAIACVTKRNTDIAVIDVVLKDIEGFKIVPIIKEINKNIRVIMTTSINFVELEGKCREVGILYYAIKPLDYNILVDVVKRAFEKHPC
jgi:DNA-binding NtrC family response regulator